MATGYTKKSAEIDVSIANGASLSAATSLLGRWPVAVVVPVAWSAADISFDVSWDDGATFAPLYDKDGEVTLPSAQIPTAAVRYLALDPTKFHGVTDIKIRSGLNGSTVNQGAARAIKIIVAD